ncbi:histidine kinase [Amycolatopsis acidiphila]|uniref:histidine kinase n=1 Tax=Amycolatopsis acidiphila TaxID=715473 RepID=A0A558A6N3_9PSEU|nr:histidine kinase [Amycolatopsis acidiphila]TVT19933.1 two-component sensor histidine kinase [Amycolatopsis acidiphila]UIJ60074.1 histidine kinase [Amycolatopsis acidiphila]GHG61498.1 two-component sensor histidine kinase [Amycolatopsis acidiphila]
MPFSDRLQPTWRKLGLEGVVLLAALLCDLVIVLPSAFDNIGPRGRDLLLLPGILAVSACALWAREHPARGAFAGAAVLVGSTALIRITDAAAFSTLLTDLSLTETVAGLELVYFAVRRLRPGMAAAATITLVVAGLFAATTRSGYSISSGRFERTMLLGAVLLIAAVAVGLRFRLAGGARASSRAAELLRSQWPLIGVLCLPLFLDLYQVLNDGPRLLPLWLCSAASAALAVFASRKPVVSGVLVSAVFAVSVVAVWIAPKSYDMPFDSLPTTEILAGTVIVVFLVRSARPAQAWPVIALMSAVVGVTTAVNVTSGRGLYDLHSLFIAALLVLGTAVAVGLYFRARDSERTKVVEAAVTEAQTSERMALARELHDVVAHHVTGIVVQAQAARMMGGKNPALAMDALGRIEEAGTEALVAMRRLVRSMRSNAAATEQATTDLDADLRRLAETAHHGVPTEVELHLTPDIPQEVARSALRLVQESLTNVGKHAAGATRVAVLAEVLDGELHVRVSDDGRTGDERPAGGSGGYGLVGMRERVELLHGRLTAGPAGGGWTVEAWLPLEGETE